MFPFRGRETKTSVHITGKGSLRGGPVVGNPAVGKGAAGKASLRAGALVHFSGVAERLSSLGL